MIFGFNFFNDSYSMTPVGNNIDIDTLKISGGIFDAMTLLNKIYSSDGIFNPVYREIWDNNTLLNATFTNTTDAGTVSQFVSDIDYLSVQRKKQDESEWLEFQTIHKDTQGRIAINFTMYDNYAANNEIYTYRVVPVDKNGNEGSSIQTDVLSSFSGAYIADNEKIFNIVYEYTLGTIKRNQVATAYTPFGSKYPYIVFNASTNYDSGSVSAILIAPTSNQGNTSYLDRKAQLDLNKEFNDWLTNGKPKVIKDYNGLCKIIAITNGVSTNYYKELGNGLASSTFDYIEIGEFTQESLNELGMVDNFKLLKRE